MKIKDQNKTSEVYLIRFVCNATVRNRKLSLKNKKKLDEINHSIDLLHKESKKLLGGKK